MPHRNLAHRTLTPIAQDGAVPAASPVKWEAAAAKPEKK
jgi:hypothetical protein